MLFGLFLSFLVVDACLGQGAFPSSWKKCPKTDMECLKDAIQGAIKSLSQGPNKVPGFPTLDPLFFGKITLLDGKDGKGKLEYQEINMKGLTDTVITKVEPVGSDGIRVHFSVPKFECLGKYEMNTKLLGITMNGAGALEMTFGHINSAIEFVFKKNSGGKNVYRATTAQIVEFSTDGFHVYHHNLFNGNKKLEESINKSLNADWKGLINELVTVGKAAFADTYGVLANSILGKISADQFELPASA